MAVSQDISVTGYEQFNSSSSSNTLTLSSYSVANVANKISVVRIVTFNNTGTAGVPTSVVSASIGTYTKFSSQFSNDNSKNFSYWVCLSPNTVTSQSVVITCDATCTKICAGVQTYKGAYTTTLAGYVYYAEVTTASSISVTHTYADANGFLLPMVVLERNSGTGTGTVTPTNGQGVQASTSFIGTYNEYLEYQSRGATITAPFSDSYNITSDGNSRKGFLYSLEIMPAAFVPLVDGTNYSPYTSCGEIGLAVATVPSLNQLNGKLVSILANGRVLDQQVVTNNQISLPSTYSRVIVGLPYTCQLQPVNVEAGLPDGTLQGRQVNITKVVLKVWKTAGGYLGPDFDNLQPIKDLQRTALINNNNGIPIYTGDIKQVRGGGYQSSGSVCIQQTDPLPMTVTAIVFEVQPGNMNNLSTT